MHWGRQIDFILRTKSAQLVVWLRRTEKTHLVQQEKKADMLRLNDLSHMSLECGGYILAMFQDLDVFILILPIGRCRSAGAEIWRKVYELLIVCNSLDKLLLSKKKKKLSLPGYAAELCCPNILIYRAMNQMLLDLDLTSL